MRACAQPLQPAAAGAEALSWVPTPRQFFVILAVYFTLHLALRTMISETIGVDESDQVVVGQHWSWGYGPQPPLFTWLAAAAMTVFGHSVFALTLLREAMLLAISVLMYYNARTLTGSHGCGLAAAAALQFHATIAWESQRELTHSILASTLVLAMFLAFVNLRARPWGAYAAFGLFGGLAVLAKYNALVMYAAILLAALSLPGWRWRVLDWRMAGALGISLLVLLPHLLWAASHRDLATASMWKFHIDPDLSWTASVLEGLRTWFKTLTFHLAAVVLVFLALFWRPIGLGGAWREAGGGTRFLWRVSQAVCLLAIGSVLVFRVTDFRERWLQPVFITVPLLLAVAVQRWLDEGRLKVILGGAAAVSLGVLVAAPGRVLLTQRLQKREILNAPFRRLAPRLAPWVEPADLVVSDDRWLLANIHLWFPERLCLTPDLVPVFRPASRRCLVVWEARRNTGSPRDLQPFIQRYCGGDGPHDPSYVWEYWKYHAKRQFRLEGFTLDRGTNQFYGYTALADPSASHGGGL